MRLEVVDAAGGVAVEDVLHDQHVQDAVLAGAARRLAAAAAQPLLGHLRDAEQQVSSARSQPPSASGMRLLSDTPRPAAELRHSNLPLMTAVPKEVEHGPHTKDKPQARDSMLPLGS